MVSALRPSSGVISANARYVGIAPATISTTAKVSAATTISRWRTRTRRAASSAPVSEPDRHERAEQAVLGGALAEDLGGHQRRRQLEVEAEGAGEEHDGQHQHQVGPAPDVAQAGADLAGLAAHEVGGVEHPRVERAQRQDRRDVADGVEQDHPAGGDHAAAEGGDQHAGDRGADEAGGVEAGGVEADGVGEVVAVDQLGHEALARGGVERRGRRRARGRARRRARTAPGRSRRAGRAPGQGRPCRCWSAGAAGAWGSGRRPGRRPARAAGTGGTAGRW